MAGLAVLMSLATSVTATGHLPVGSADEAQLALWPAEPRQSVGQRPENVARRARPGMLLARLKTDHLVRNSLFLILSSAVQATLGVTFWIIAARLFSTADVGRASSLISATGLAAFFALLGLNSTFVRFLPTVPDRERDALITAGLILVAVCGAGIGLGYVLLTPLLAPRLAFVAHQPMLAIGFALLTAAVAVNLLTDSIFIAGRKAGNNALVDGGIGGITKLVSCVVLAGTGAYGLFCASVGGFAVAALASLLLMTKALHWRPSLRSPGRTLWPMLRFSGANYAGNVLNALPTWVVPLIVLDRIGASAAAYYFVSFQAATLLYAAAYAVEQAFLAEGAHVEVVRRELMWRSARLLMALCLPAWLVLTVAAHWVLLAFGVKYSQYGASSLMVLAAAAVPIAAINWLLTLLRLAGQLAAIVVSNAVYSMAICGLAWVLAPRGLTAMSAAWPIGALVGAVAAGLVTAATVPRAAPGRHRRTTRARRV